MLNLTEIAIRIRQPELCRAEDIDSLRTLCDTYPYSQVFPLLYLKTLAQTNDVRLDNELQKFAYRISDRAVLFDLLQNKKAIGEPESQYTEILNEIPQKRDILTVNEEFVTEKNLETKEKVVDEEIITFDEEIQIIDEEIGEVTSEEVTNFTIETKTPQEELPSLPDDVLNSIGIGSEMYSLEAEEAEIARQKSKEKERFEEETLEKEKQKLIESLAQKKAIAERIEEELIIERSFTSWLKHNSFHVQQDEEKADPIALIERFIQDAPKISSPKEKLFEDRTDKNEMFNPTKKAKESLDESQLPVSETLAKIFAAQGNYPKAIYAYQQLMLIFPEKKVFFATQIEELNKKLNT